MEAKEKAEELLFKYYNVYGNYSIPVEAFIYSKKCAIIACDEIMDWSKPSDDDCGVSLAPTYDYWNEVKQEIEKL